MALSRSELLDAIASRIDAEQDVGWLKSLRVDFFLAAGCISGDREARNYLREACVSKVRAALAPLGPVDWVDDMEQRLWTKLFSSPAALSKYSGRGSLVGWVRTVAVRSAQDVLRRQAWERPADVEWILDRTVDPWDAELSRFKKLYQGDFKRAFKQAFNALEPRQRNMLRYEFVDGLSIEQIGDLYRVHRTTANRWQRTAREKLLADSRRIFMQSQSLSTREFDSMMQFIRSELDLSLPRVLAHPRGG